MAKCCNIAVCGGYCLSQSFGLKSTTTVRHNGATSIHSWIPKSYNLTKPNLVLIHGIGGNAKWQWSRVVSRVTPFFNVYVPDLPFYGDSYTTRPERTEEFQAECVMKTLEAVGLIGKINVVGLRYGGFVGYSMAVKFPKAVERVVVIGCGVCLDSEIDLEEGMFSSKNINDAAELFLPQTPEKLRELLRISFYKPPNPDLAPDCIVNCFIEEINIDNFKEKKECIETLQKDRKFPNLPKIIQPTLIT